MTPVVLQRLKDKYVSRSDKRGNQQRGRRFELLRETTKGSRGTPSEYELAELGASLSLAEDLLRVWRFDREDFVQTSETGEQDSLEDDRLLGRVSPSFSRGLPGSGRPGRPTGASGIQGKAKEGPP